MCSALYAQGMDADRATYVAHVVTAQARDLGAPETVVMAQSGKPGEGVVLVRYALTVGGDPLELLAKAGWRPRGAATHVESGYYRIDVEAADWATIVSDVTVERAKAEAEQRRQETAWRTIVRDAVHAGASPTSIAAAAGISRGRVYQIRDGRR